MNRYDWYEVIQETKRRHTLEFKELRDRQAVELAQLTDAMCAAPPTAHFTASKMRLVDANKMTDADNYHLSA